MAIWDYLSININFILSSKAFPTGGINYKACNIGSCGSSSGSSGSALSVYGNGFPLGAANGAGYTWLPVYVNNWSGYSSASKSGMSYGFGTKGYNSSTTCYPTISTYEI